jgi:hypothetical protein
MLPALRPASKLLTGNTLLVFQPDLAAIIGLEEAVMLQQIHYWLGQGGHERDGRRWIYNSYAEWTAQFPFWNKDKVRRVVEHLRRRGLVRTARYNRHSYDHTTWYTIDYDAVAALGLPPPPAPLDPPDPPAAPPPARPAAVPTIPASVPGAPDVVCAAPSPTWQAERGATHATCHSERSEESRRAATTPPTCHSERSEESRRAAITPPACHSERSEESRRATTPAGGFTAFSMTPARGSGASLCSPIGASAAAAPGGAAAPGPGTVAAWPRTVATSGGKSAPGGGSGAPPIPETTSETTSEINSRERARGGAPPPPAFETLTMTDALTGWLAAECAAQGVPLQGLDARYETDKWRDEIRAGRRAVPADAAADWRQWMRRALTYSRRHQPTGPTTHVPASLPTGPTPAIADDLAAREAKAAAGFRARMDLLFGRTAAGSGGAAALCPV